MGATSAAYLEVAFSLFSVRVWYHNPLSLSLSRAGSFASIYYYGALVSAMLHLFLWRTLKDGSINMSEHLHIRMEIEPFLSVLAT